MPGTKIRKRSHFAQLSYALELFKNPALENLAIDLLELNVQKCIGREIPFTTEEEKELLIDATETLEEVYNTKMLHSLLVDGDVAKRIADLAHYYENLTKKLCAMAVESFTRASVVPASPHTSTAKTVQVINPLWMHQHLFHAEAVIVEEGPKA